jgi:hypothetical protein
MRPLPVKPSSSAANWLEGKWACAFPALILLLLIPIYGLAIHSTAVGLIHDDGIYVVTGKAMAEGRGYEIDSYPTEMRQTKYPVVLPFLVSLGWRINSHFPENIPLLKSIPVLAFIAWGVICFQFFRRRALLSSAAALWVLVFVASNQWSLYTTGAVMSEATFAALVMGCLLFVARAEDQPLSSDRQILFAALLAGAAYLTRTAGLMLIISVVIALLARRRFRQAAVFSGVSALFVLVWIIWQQHPGDTETPGEAYYTARNYSDWSLLGGAFPLREELAVVYSNLVRIVTYPSRLIFTLPLPQARFGLVRVGVGLLFWILFLRGVKNAPSKLLPSALFVVLNCGMLLAWAWSPDRFMLPVLPLLLIFAYLGLPSNVPRSAVLFLLPLPLLMIVLAAQNTAAHGIGAFAPAFWDVQSEHPPSDWRLMSEVHRWIASNTPSDSVVLANFDPAVYLYTGRKSIRPFTVEGPQLFYDIRRPVERKVREAQRIIDKFHAGYLVETGHDSEEEPDFDQILEGLRAWGRLRLEQEIAPHYRIWRITPALSKGTFK